MSRYTTFRYCLDPTVEQRAVLARHAGAVDRHPRQPVGRYRLQYRRAHIML
ncbi:helix-turn-helix domain-containing protein [Nocardia sp. CA-129566]|uniref:helix-turn-helix domain-containing protein n=1 Tax=Nocardia sp. CA-129566 TaxID=3239976 RepID=UPI003D961C69